MAATTTYAYHDHPTTGDNANYQLVTDPNGNTTRTDVDAQGRTVKVTYDVNADGSIPTGAIFTSNSYGLYGQTVTSTDELGRSTVRKDDNAGNLVEVDQPQVLNPATGNMTTPVTTYGYDAYGDETSQTDANGHVTLFTFNALGQETSRTLPDGESESNTYDAFGREFTSTDFKGQTTGYTYDDSATGDGRITGEYFFAAGVSPFDDNGNIQTSSFVADDFTLYTYNDVGRTATITDSTGVTTDSYDADGNLAKQVNPEGTINNVYDAATGRLTETWTGVDRSHEGTDTSYGYDAQGRLGATTVTVLNGVTLTADQITIDTYDPDGNKKTELLPSGDLTTYSYNGRNELTDEAVTKETTNVFAQHYTLADNGRRDAVNETQYNGDGSVFSTVNIAWGYDNLDRLTSEDYTSSVSGQSYADTFNYDLVGDRLTKTHSTSSGDESIAYAYNHDDQLQTETATLNGSPEYAAAYGYDANGSLITKTRTDHNAGFNVTVDDGSGQRSMVDRLTVTFNHPVTLSSNAFTLTGAAAGPVTLSVSNPSGDQKTYLITFSGSTVVANSLPDGIYSLVVAASGVHDAGTGAQTLAADESYQFHRLFGDINGDGVVDNTDYEQFKSAERGLHIGYNPAFDYDGNGSIDSADADQFSARQEAGLSYSTGSVQVDSYTYDVRDNLARSTVDGAAASYVTDSAGDRVSQTAGSGSAATTSSLVDDNNLTGYSQVLEQSTGGAITTSYIIGDRVLGQATSGAPSYLISDGQGSTRLVTDSTGAVTDRYSYDSFGNALGFDANGAVTSVLYTGQQFDAGLGLYHLRARDYDPLTGTFTSFDSANNTDADPISLHKYLYAGADPVLNFDPSGHATSLAAAALGRAVHKALGDDFIQKLRPFGISGPSIATILTKYFPPLSSFVGPVTSRFPDLVDIDPNNKEVFEIKPANLKAYATGLAQLIGYIYLLNKLDPTGRWHEGNADTYMPPPILTIVDPEDVEDPVDVVAVFPPIAGVITYSSVEDVVKERVKNVSEAEEAEMDDEFGVDARDAEIGGF